LNRKIPTSCKDEDKLIEKFIDLITKTFSGSENGFKEHQCKDESLAVFFEMNDTTLPTSDELIHKFIETAIEMALLSTSEYAHLELEALGILIGAFANGNFVLDLYDEFILNCLTETNSKFASLSKETQIKMAIRAVVHSKRMTSEFARAFIEFTPINGFITSTIDTLIQKNGVNKSTILVQIQQKKNDEQFDVKTVKLFGSLNDRWFDEDAIEDLVWDLEKLLTEHPECRKQIINYAISSLLEKVTPKTLKFVGPIMKEILTKIKPSEITEQITCFELLVEELKFDLPKVNDTWIAILQTL
jgi:hypothetical protein